MIPELRCLEAKNGFYSESFIISSDLSNFTERPIALRWYGYEHLNDREAIEDVGNYFGLHPLLVEDIVHQNQRPELDDPGQLLLVTVPTFSWNPERMEVTRKQINILWRENDLVTFASSEKDLLEPVRQRIRRGKRSHYRDLHPDFLFCAVLDLLVDQHLEFLDEIRVSLILMEDTLSEKPDPQLLQEVYRLRRQMISVARVMPSVRSLVGELYDDYSEWFREENLMYLRDVQDHSQQAPEFVKADQEILSGMIDLYLSLMSQKTNDKMKVLAVISTIFMPLTLIARIYGMNFQHIPELGWEFGYPMVLLFMLVIGIGIGWFLKQKDWF
ncbi:MAG: magnesium/cobalt transporter CorA [Deltaproteobacteria bacterium]|nr:magnesium/cobalt transporter CorA [Deltaproteobacteria bacterium]